MTKHRYPNPEELYALERRARRERSQVLGQMLISGVKTLFSLSSRAARTFATPRARRQELGHA